MPTRARAAPLVGEMSVFATASLHGRRVVYAPHGSDAAVAPPTQAQLEEYVKLTGARVSMPHARARTPHAPAVRTHAHAPRRTQSPGCALIPCASRCIPPACVGQNTTTFSASEKRHPINVFEQVNVCVHCGCERFTSTRPTQCCEGGKLLLDRAMPPRLLRIIAGAPGLSKQSRCANSLFRFAQACCEPPPLLQPRDAPTVLRTCTPPCAPASHHIPDHFQHLKITGVPYALVNNLNETSSTRSFLEDPDLRLEARDRYATVLQSIDAVLRSSNPLVMQLVNWSEATTSAIACVFEENAALKAFAKTQIPGAQMRWIPDWNMWALHIPTAPMARDFHAALLADKSMAATAAKVNRALDISPYRDPAATKYKFTLASSELQFETVADGLLDRSIMIVGNVYHFKELLKARFPQIKYLDLVFNNGDTIKAAWVLPESAQTKDTGTLAEYLTSLGVEVSEIDLDEEEDDDDDSDLDDDDLIDAEAEEAGEEEEEE